MKFIKVPSRAKKMNQTGMAVGVGAGAAVVGGVVYVLASSGHDWGSNDDAAITKTLRASTAYADFGPPTNLLPSEEKLKEDETQPVALPAVPTGPSVKEVARRKAAAKAWDNYYETKLALEKRRTDALDNGMASLWEGDNREPAKSQGQSQHAPQIVGAENLPQLASASGMQVGGSAWTQADNRQSWSEERIGGSPHLQSLRQSPISPYQVMAGNYLPAITKGGITSDAPASVVGQITSDVYCDTPAGRTAGAPCIPKGTQVLISYNTRVVQGECRVQLAADRFIFPDSTSMDLGHMPIGDASGYAGVQDGCHTHLGARLLNAVLFTTVQGAFGLGQAALGANYVNGSSVESVAQQEASAGMRIPPTLTVRPGMPFKIMLRKDLIFTQPYTAQTGLED